MTQIFILTAFLILTVYIVIHAGKFGIRESLSASYYDTKGWFQLALGSAGFLMTVSLLNMTEGKWYQFLSFFATSALIFVAFAPDYKNILEGKVHVAAAMISAIAALALIVLMGYWYVPVLPFLASVFIIRKWGNKTYWLEMACFAGIYILTLLEYIIH